MENAGEVGGEVGEFEAHAFAGMEIGDGGVGFDEFIVGEDFDEDIAARGKRVGHLDIAAVDAEIADARGGAGIFRLVGDLGHGLKWITLGAAAFDGHSCLPGRKGLEDGSAAG